MSAHGASPRPRSARFVARLHAAGATVLYGTDLGNTRTAAIDVLELQA